MNKQLPLPTNIQYDNFAEYICEAHSWYKHISLFDGAEFIFFLSENAGGDYSEDRPRLHYAWKTTKEYRQRFGYLDYAYRICDEKSFHRDFIDDLLMTTPGNLASSFSDRPKSLDSCSVILYPFVSYNSEVVFSIAYDRIEEIENDCSLPNRDGLIRWINKYLIFIQSSRLMSNADREMAYEMEDIDWRKIDECNLPINIIKYLKQQEISWQFYLKLQSSELAKIRKGLSNLQELALQGLPVWY